jgi:indole-3-glycerol phosphate synthase
MTPTRDDRLAPILESVRARAEERRRLQDSASLRKMVKVDPGRRDRFTAALRCSGLSVIAEIKRRSPSAGAICGEVDVAGRALQYATGGAAAISVLTEGDHFGGSLIDLEHAGAGGLPRLRKDFLLDEDMVVESAVHGADAVLLLACCLTAVELQRLRRLAGELGLAVLVEIHTEEELTPAVAAEPDAIGVNARDLSTLRVTPGAAERLLPLVPARFLLVAESGIATGADLARVAALGAEAALVGEALMRSPDPVATLCEWRPADIRVAAR